MADTRYSKPLEHHKYKVPPYFGTDDEGYERVQTKFRGVSKGVGVHRLMAVSEYGFDAVCGKVVHHKSNIPWDNRMDNLELMTPSEHSIHHNTDDFVGREKIDGSKCEQVRSEYGDRTIEELAREFDASTTAICKHIQGKCSHTDKDVSVGYEGPRDGPWRDKDTFKEAYVDEGMTYKELVEEWGCSLGTISRWANRHGLV